MSTDVIAQSNTPQPSSRQEGIPMSVVSAKRPCNRMPARPIYVYQDGRTLMFDEEHAGDTVTVMDGDKCNIHSNYWLYYTARVFLPI